MAIEIASCPIQNGGSFHSYVTVYQRVFMIKFMIIIHQPDDHLFMCDHV